MLFVSSLCSCVVVSLTVFKISSLDLFCFLILWLLLFLLSWFVSWFKELFWEIVFFSFIGLISSSLRQLLLFLSWLFNKISWFSKTCSELISLSLLTTSFSLHISLWFSSVGWLIASSFLTSSFVSLSSTILCCSLIICLFSGLFSSEGRYLSSFSISSFLWRRISSSLLWGTSFNNLFSSLFIMSFIISGSFISLFSSSFWVCSLFIFSLSCSLITISPLLSLFSLLIKSSWLFTIWSSFISIFSIIWFCSIVFPSSSILSSNLFELLLSSIIILFSPSKPLLFSPFSLFLSVNLFSLLSIIWSIFLLSSFSIFLSVIFLSTKFLFSSTIGCSSFSIFSSMILSSIIILFSTFTLLSSNSLSLFSILILFSLSFIFFSFSWSSGIKALSYNKESWLFFLIGENPPNKRSFLFSLFCSNSSLILKSSFCIGSPSFSKYLLHSSWLLLILSLLKLNKPSFDNCFSCSSCCEFFRFSDILSSLLFLLISISFGSWSFSSLLFSSFGIDWCLSSSSSRWVNLLLSPSIGLLSEKGISSFNPLSLNSLWSSALSVCLIIVSLLFCILSLFISCSLFLLILLLSSLFSGRISLCSINFSSINSLLVSLIASLL